MDFKLVPGTGEYTVADNLWKISRLRPGNQNSQQ